MMNSFLFTRRISYRLFIFICESVLGIIISAHNVYYVKFRISSFRKFYMPGLYRTLIKYLINYRLFIRKYLFERPCSLKISFKLDLLAQKIVQLKAPLRILVSSNSKMYNRLQQRRFSNSIFSGKWFIRWYCFNTG